MADQKLPEAARKMPIPPPAPDDHDDVSWALSTAEATWKRGERADALKWLRRAAEAASEAGADDRALTLAKAAAELASELDGPRPAPPTAAKVLPAGRFDLQKPRVPVSPARTHLQGSSRGRVTPPQSNAENLAERAIPPAPITAPDLERSAHLAAAAKRSESTDTPMMVTPSAPETPPAPTVARSTAATTDDMDAWPTASHSGDLMGFDETNHTRIGTSAYVEEARAGSADVTRSPFEARASQAVRVVVWRAPDGVHVAPHGTMVSAISVDAMLVALDPSADLSAWLSNK